MLEASMRASPARSRSRGLWRPTRRLPARVDTVAVRAPMEKTGDAAPTLKPKTFCRRKGEAAI